MSDPSPCLSGSTPLPQFISVDVELTSICHNHCAMCPRDAITRHEGMMSRQTFASVLHFLGDSRCLLTFSGMGDPLLHRALPDFIGQAVEAGHQTGVVVHPASLMARNGLALLLSTPPDTITVSFPSVRSHVFEQLCPSISMEHALEQVKRLVNRAGGRCSIRISGIICRLNRDEACEFREFWKALGLSSWITRCHTRGGYLQRPQLAENNTKPASWRGICSLFLFHSFITWDGTLLACCHDLEGRTRLGCIGHDHSKDTEKTVTGHNVLEHYDQLLEIKQHMTTMRPCPAFRLCSRCDEPLRDIPLPDIPGPGDMAARRKFFKKLARLSGRGQTSR